MTAEFFNNTPEQGKITVRYEAWADAAKMTAIVGNIAEWRHHNGEGPVDENDDQIPFGELTNQQKLDIVFDYVKRKHKDWSENWARDVAESAISIDPTDHEFDEE